MHLDAADLKEFYARPLGRVVRRLLGARLRSRWSDLKSCRTFGLGFVTPYLAPFRAEAEPLGALMPARLGAILWPEQGQSLSVLVEDTELPLIDEGAVATFEDAANEAKKNGNVITGGERLTEGAFAKGTFVQPTVAEVPLDSWIWKKELFVPFVSVAPYEDLDEAIRLANDTEYGLTAGFYSEDRGEIDRWLSSIEAGVVYVNRRAGATTGAWPGVQPFGGWKGSGTSGKAGGGPYYVQQYLREQSRTVIEE